jgi:hypothetical protein
MIAELPDPDDPAPALYSPGGELHDLAPTTPGAATDQGMLPREIEPLESGGTDPLTPSELSHPQTMKYQQPISVSLNEADPDTPMGDIPPPPPPKPTPRNPMPALRKL